MDIDTGRDGYRLMVLGKTDDGLGEILKVSDGTSSILLDVLLSSQEGGISKIMVRGFADQPGKNNKIIKGHGVCLPLHLACVRYKSNEGVQKVPPLIDYLKKHGFLSND